MFYPGRAPLATRSVLIRWDRGKAGDVVLHASMPPSRPLPANNRQRSFSVCDSACPLVTFCSELHSLAIEGPNTFARHLRSCSVPYLLTWRPRCRRLSETQPCPRFPGSGTAIRSLRLRLLQTRRRSLQYDINSIFSPPRHVFPAVRASSGSRSHSYNLTYPIDSRTSSLRS